ncbi:lipid kinase YegS [Pseudidiomarina piscicola]|uniref:Lipid kinase YegS n=1 Tax=Pseudidiomarina piscicola TaxID=2614830 RepID=A0A6S6WMZ4_9GAMM|nr:diacylglycerol kinase family protein [Pseudidiomarina piscicola]CAB0150092.1 lipid kinase YegS [Pseudidiomarina piscicola]VZT39533.1 lipid kinase YegS [Pseudomonas aeruginosa]
MQNSAIAIYYKSNCARARGYAETYQQQFHQDYGVTNVTLIASSGHRGDDVKRLINWRDAQSATRARECVVIGGDGSLNIVAQMAAQSTVAVTVIPCGTGNDFASALEIRDWRWRLEDQGEVLERTIGKAGDYYFINHAGAGLTVAMQSYQGSFSRRWLGRYSYISALLRYLLLPPSRRCKLQPLSASSSYGYDELQIVALNRTIGGGIVVYPQAAIASDTLAVLTVPKCARWRQMSALYWLLRGQPKRSSMITFAEVRQVQLGDADNIIEFDGDRFELCGPVTIEVIRAGLRVRRPTLT